MTQVIEVRILASKNIDKVWDRIMAAQDAATKEQLEVVGDKIIERSKEFLDRPFRIFESENRQGGEGMTSDGALRVYPVGHPLYNTYIKESFKKNRRGSNKYSRAMAISNDAAYSAHVHQGSTAGELAGSIDLIGALKGWANRKAPGVFDDAAINAIYDALTTGGMPPLPFLRIAAHDVMNDARDPLIRALRDKVKSAVTKR